MKEEIQLNLHNPAALEALYRKDRTVFRSAFQSLYPELAGNPLIEFWKERLFYRGATQPAQARWELLWLITASLIAGLLARIPSLTGVAEEQFYSRNVSFLVLPFLLIYFARQNRLPARKLLLPVAGLIVSIVFINLLPETASSQTLLLSCIHLPIFLWFLLGIVYTTNVPNETGSRLSFLKYNGDLLLMLALLMIAAGITTGVTFGLFQMIGLDIRSFYFEQIAVSVLPAVPLLANFLIRRNPQLVGKISPVIARLFSPVVLLMLLIYLISIIWLGRNPYQDRNFLLLFNVLLLGVMAIIFFAVAGTAETGNNKMEIIVLFGLSLLCMVINGIALSAILIRISDGGFSANKTAVLGTNLLMLLHLLAVSGALFNAIRNKHNIKETGKVIVRYLPVYFVWIVLVLFFFPLIFGFS
jgi:hypothetical protein